MIKTGIFILLILALAACDSLSPEPPTLTPTRALSAPTLQPSPVVFALPPTEIPADFDLPGSNNPIAAALPANSNLPPAAIGTPDGTTGFQTIQIPLADGRLLAGNLYENAPIQLEQGVMVQRLPGLLIIGAGLDAWGILPAQLRDAGYTVLVMDLDDAVNTKDFSAVLHAFIETNSVYPALIGVIGASRGADRALIGCAVELLCDAAVLLSPIGQNTLSNIIADYNLRPLLVIASSEDAASYNTAGALSTWGNVTFQAYENAGHGVELLTNQPDIAGVILTWLQNNFVE